MEFRSGGSWVVGVERRQLVINELLSHNKPDTDVAHVMYVLASRPGPATASTSSAPAAESIIDGVGRQQQPCSGPRV